MEHRSSIEVLIKELQRYVNLRVQRTKFIVVEKCVYLLAIMAFVCIATLFIAIAICYLSYSFVHLLQIFVGAIAAHAIVAMTLLLAVWLLYRQRRYWILDPIARVMTRILIDDDEPK